MKNYFNWMSKCFLVLTVLVCIAGFAGSGLCETKIIMPGVDQIENATIEQVKKEKPVSGVGPYSTIIVEPFEASDALKNDYKDAITQFQVGLVSSLKGKNVFTKVLDGGDENEAGTVKVTGKILDMRITSSAARFWGGALAGSSYMNIYLNAMDVKTGKVINEKIITTANNPIAAAWIGGGSDRSLPMDLGQIVSEYLCMVIPAK